MVKEFAEELRNEILSRLTEEDGVNSIEIQEVTKNNNMVQTGLAFKSDSNVAPLIYVNNAFEQYEKGMPLVEIAENMIKTFHESVYNGPTDADDFINFDKIKDKLTVCVVNTENNKEMLAQHPHIDILDVSLIARIEISKDESCIGTVKVNNELLERYEITKEQLFEQAWGSMKENHPYECIDMVDEIKRMNPDMPDSLYEDMCEHKGELFVLMNKTGISGASYGFDNETLTKICEQIGTDGIYIMPSSINEVIITPEEKVEEPERLARTVADVNATQVPEDEILSNNAYHFDKNTQMLSVVNFDESMDMNFNM